MPDRTAPDPDPSATTRRTVLQALGLAALAGGGAAALGSCSAGDGTGTVSDPTANASAPPTSAVPGTSPPAAASPTAPVTTPSGPGIAVRDVPVGGGVILNDADYVITQPTAGDFRAFSKFCAHQQCPLASVGGGMINCMCHGGRYSMWDGSVQAGPPPGPLPPAKVTVAGDWVVVTG